MFLTDLITKAQKALDENGDIDVTVYADHGQEETHADRADIEWLDEEGEVLHPDDYFDGDEDRRKTKVFSISGG